MSPGWMANFWRQELYLLLYLQQLPQGFGTEWRVVIVDKINDRDRLCLFGNNKMMVSLNL